MRMGHFPSRPMVSQNVSASGVAAVVTLAADTNRCHSLRAIHLTYDGGAPGVKTVTIAFTQNTVATTVIIAASYTAAITGIIELNDWLVGDINTAVTITAELLAVQIGTLNVFHA